MSKCVKCNHEHSNTVNEMCYKCFSAIQEKRRQSEIKKRKVRLRRHDRKRKFSN